jgi:RNA-binding protein
MPLSSRQTHFLRALAHPLVPVVYVGAAGVTDGVIDKTDKDLEAHELIKVKVEGTRDVVRESGERLAIATHAEVAQVIGKTVVLYRRRKKKPTIVLPKAKVEKPAKPAKPAKAESSG